MSSTASTATANEKKKDEGWEYGEARDPANRNAVWCKLCNKKCTTGISRLKEHRIGRYPSVTKCPNVPVEVSKKFKDIADKNIWGGLEGTYIPRVESPTFKQAVTKMQTFIDTFRVHWKTYGCTIMSDWWTDKKGRTLINFLVNCPKGTVFLRSIDGSAHVHDAELIRGMLDSVIQEIVTDNASNYVKAAAMLEKDYPTLYWSPCTAHCLDLILEDIGELKAIKDVVRDGKSISIFVCNHLHVLSLMRRFTNKRDLVRLGVTRFATNFFSLENLFGLKTQLRAMFNSEEWSNSKWSKRIEGRKVARIVSRAFFWKKVEHACKIMAPLVDVVCLVDREERPCMGYIYEAMDRAKEIIKKNLGDDERTIATLVRDEEENDKVVRQLQSYREGIGLLGSSSARRNMSKMNPGEWWMTYGSDVPELQKLAIRILREKCIYEKINRLSLLIFQVHTKKRNKLDSAKLNDLVFVMYNRKLEVRYKRRQNELVSKEDHILLRDVEDCNEWVTYEVLPEYVHPGEDLTYEQVEAAVLGDDVGHSTRSRTTETRGEQSQPCGVVEGFIDETKLRHRVSRSTGVQPQPRTYQRRAHLAHLIDEEEDEADDMEINEEDDGNSDDDGLVSGEEELGDAELITDL
ncbi:hypothetical protein GIB67_022967 [Kingdonia uniflora]|uniref:BED-type domain-containing protein n=1 Tax=Kingdonia uniflora TaxID=39325 RepID=A0A7J7P363_9MAGN|nr:hypothetical protein GIB67_022967 [Kingdonia uniflora]